MKCEDRAFVVIAIGIVMLGLLMSSMTNTKSEDFREPELIYVKGGRFSMGDVFAEGAGNELPVHEVELSGFYLGKHEITVAEFSTFVSETDYQTSAESPIDKAAQASHLAQASTRKMSPDESRRLKEKMLEYGGTAYWDPIGCVWTGYRDDIDWRNPGFAQSDDEPVLCVSPDDARHYCNWLSVKLGLPAAYDLETGQFLDESGQPTQDITRVRGFRLPTEAEWEYAAREGGKKVRFGNGKNIANADEINFRADAGDYSYLKKGGYRSKTVSVGSFEPNSLDLHDMSGNAWEWAGDCNPYGIEILMNPCLPENDTYALRGGRWGGDAFEARVFSRSSWVRNDRCNNSGFRIARSAS
jgi:formylglycine-generating enzyme required for sulfatase activity